MNTTHTTVLITGGSGLLGRSLTRYLSQKNYKVRWLSRNKQIPHPPGTEVYEWNPSAQTIDKNALRHVEVIIHLSGSGIADKRWTKAYKKELHDSRVHSALLLARCIRETRCLPSCFIGASAIGFYGMQISPRIFTEKDYSHDDFLGTLCQQWENSYEHIQSMNIRTCIVRTGLVLSPHGGLYKKLRPLHSLGLTPVIGTGMQNMPWIHIEDWCRIIEFLISHSSCHGIYNLVQGDPVNQRTFSYLLTHSLGKKLNIVIPLPLWLLHLFFGEMSRMLTSGVIVSSEKIRKCGYKFIYESLPEAFASLNPYSASQNDHIILK